MTPARLRWGLLFILLGGLRLAEQLGHLNSSVWWDFLNLLPFFFIAIGIEKIFTGSRLEFVSYAAVVVFMGGAAFVAADGGVMGDSGGYFESSSYTQEAVPTIESIHATVKFGDNGLTVRDATEELVYARFPEYSHKPVVDYQEEGNRATVVISAKSTGFVGSVVHVDLDDPGDWKLWFNQEMPLFLELLGERAELHLNLATTPLRQIDINADDAEIYLKIGDLLPQVDVVVTGNESKLRLRVPESSGLRVKGKEHESLLRRLGMNKGDDHFTTEDFDMSSNKIEVDLDDRFRSLSIDFY
jgi:hypothetical protein